MEDRKRDEKIGPYYCEISGISKEASGYWCVDTPLTWRGKGLVNYSG